MHIRLTTCLLILALIGPTAGCGDEGPAPDAAAVPTIDALIEQARAASARDPEGTTLPGIWRTQSAVEGGGFRVWADLIWIIGETHAWHAVLVYTDASRSTPLARWDILRAYHTGGPAAIAETAVQLDWQDVSSYLTVYTDMPEVVTALGIDDCAPAIGAAFSTADDNCGAPFFPFRDCTLMDFADVTPAGLTFGEPRATDRCVERVDVYEGWTFEQVPFDGDLPGLLADRPAAL